MKVIKIGGGCLKGKKNITRIIDLITGRCQGEIIVLSALNGITDLLIQGMQDALASEESIPPLMARLKSRHLIIARHLIKKGKHLRDFNRDLGKHLNALERFYYGLNFTRELTPRMTDMIASYGERFSAVLLTAILRARGFAATCCMPHRIGLITDGKFSDATADLRKTTANFKETLLPLLHPKAIVFVPGFFGVSPGGDITTFGRGGSDYAAAVLAAALKADLLEIWKDVAGFMSCDPRLVPEASLIAKLSYEEAAELAYFGARILHPRTMEPVRLKKIEIAIKNTLDPDAPGSLITNRSPRQKSIIKSVAHNDAIGTLKVHASGVGARPGILAQVSGQLTHCGINIKAVVTSQTCISLLLDKKDLEAGLGALKSLKPRPYRRIEKSENIALISIVGEGLFRRKGIAARCFTAVADSGVNVEMISFGPSRAALYFLTRKSDLGKAVLAIHKTFFPAKG